MSKSKSLITSPVGEIQFLALNNKVNKNMTKDSAEGYAIRLKYDGNTKEGAAWRKTIEQINPGIVGAKHINKAGEFTVRAFSKFDVLVLDASGNEIEERPNFYAGSKGTASMTLQPYTENAMGGAVNLVAVTIHSFDNSEATETTSSREDLLKHLREQLNESK